MLENPYIDSTMHYLYNVQAVLVDELRDELDALLVGGYLGTKIRQVVLQKSCSWTRYKI